MNVFFATDAQMINYFLDYTDDFKNHEDINNYCHGCTD